MPALPITLYAMQHCHLMHTPLMLCCCAVCKAHTVSQSVMARADVILCCCSKSRSCREVWPTARPAMHIWKPRAPACSTRYACMQSCPQSAINFKGYVMGCACTLCHEAGECQTLGAGMKQLDCAVVSSGHRSTRNTSPHKKHSSGQKASSSSNIGNVSISSSISDQLAVS